jgi:hypothetical protein
VTAKSPSGGGVGAEVSGEVVVDVVLGTVAGTVAVVDGLVVSPLPEHAPSATRPTTAHAATAAARRTIPAG